ncbi:putative hydrolase or acyltransferase of alpha/beta superfamily [Frankia sp. QA3]|nr:putative hydrolase or acyltransferase of alpha/beta superfamily [Frankia sp. QA3]
MAAGLDLHVEDVRPDDGPPGAWPPEDPRPGETLPPGEKPPSGEKLPPSGPQPPRETRPVGAPRAGVGADGSPVVLVHGIAGSTADWAAVAADLATSRRVIAYDHRGHGASGRAPGGRAGYSFGLLLADLTALIATLGPAGVHLVGHSLGGVIALRYALDHPGRVRSLVLVDTAAAPATGPVAKRIVAAVLEGVAAIASGTGPAHADGRSGGTADGPVGAAEVSGSVGAVHDHRSPAQRQVEGLGQADPDALAALGRELGDYPSLVPRLGEITVPTTVIVGEHDSTLRAGARTLAHGIPAAHLAVIAGADHSPQVSRPLAWLAAVDDHFARVEAAAAG